MTPVITVMITMAASAWLRYSTGAVLAAYEVGRRVERVLRRAAR